MPWWFVVFSTLQSFFEERKTSLIWYGFLVEYLLMILSLLEIYLLTKHFKDLICVIFFWSHHFQCICWVLYLFSRMTLLSRQFSLLFLLHHILRLSSQKSCSLRQFFGFSGLGHVIKSPSLLFRLFMASHFSVVLDLIVFFIVNITPSKFIAKVDLFLYVLTFWLFYTVC